jgi:hypothetical protein
MKRLLCWLSIHDWVSVGNFSHCARLYGAIEHATFTPTEIREAAMLAQIKYEELHIRPVILERGWPTKSRSL